MGETSAPFNVVGYGEAGIDEMRGFVDDSRVQFGLVRFEIAVGTTKRNKVIFVHINGERMSAVARGRENEYLADAMNILRCCGEYESFHASVEFTRKDEVTADHVMERIKKILMSDDPGDYDAKWLMKNYEQFILESAKAAAKSHKSDDDKGRKRGCPGHISDSLFNNGRDALKAVAGPLGAWNWVFLKPDPDTLLLVEGGDGSVDQMRECMERNPKEVLCGLLRMGFGTGRGRRTKYVFVMALGKEVTGFQKGKAGGVRGKMEAAFKGFAASAISCSAEFDDPADFTIEAVIEKVRKAAIIDDDDLDGDKAGKNMLSVEHFRAALKEDCAVIEAEEAKAPPKASGGFGDKDIEELVRCVRAPGSPQNWVLFCRNDKVRKSQAAVQRGSANLRPSINVAPVGGYMQNRQRASTEPAGYDTRASSGTVVTPDACASPTRKNSDIVPTRMINLRASTGGMGVRTANVAAPDVRGWQGSNGKMGAPTAARGRVAWL